MGVKMINIRQITIAVIFILITISSCYYDKKEELYGPNKCNTTGLTYTKDISVLVNQSCVGCHNASNPSAGIQLHDYVSVVDCIKNGKFVGSVKQDGTASNMPKGGSKWGSCELSKLDAWIQGGYQQ